MCFFKNSKAFTTKTDLYVLKFSIRSPLMRDEFPAAMDFIYKKGVRYRKGIMDRIRAYFRSELNGEVFHCIDILKSKSLVKVMRTILEIGPSESMGVFRIPAGSVVYHNRGHEELVTFDIEYIGPLDKGVAGWVENQSDIP